MESFSALQAPADDGLKPVDSLPAKQLSADSFGSAEEAGLSTVCCSSEDEASAGVYPSDDERQESDVQQQAAEKVAPATATPQAAAPADTQQPLQFHTADQLPSRPAPFTYTVSGLENMSLADVPSVWLKPRIKVDGPEIFHGVLRANDDSLQASETVPSTETFVSFHGKWRVVTSAGTSSYIGPTMNPWDPSTAAYPLPITYKVSEEKAVVRDSAASPPTSAASRLGFFEQARRFISTAVAEYMQS
ncbi:hypothetical protein Efla_007555 [Eimeria flavescens]